MNHDQLADFIRESNAIEGIKRAPTEDEVESLDWFIDMPNITTGRMSILLSKFQPDARLRDKPGMNVRVGDYRPKSGGPDMPLDLACILEDATKYRGSHKHAYRIHQAFETLHPFTDGNGRTGRALWLWMMRGDAPLGFLHTFYYQSLQFGGRDTHDGWGAW